MQARHVYFFFDVTDTAGAWCCAGVRRTTNTVPILVRSPDGPYFSNGDERAFFEWVSRLRCMKRVEGVGPELRLHVSGRRLSDTCLQELVALFLRYGVSMRQLAQFETPKNRAWFRSRQAVWYEAVFGRSGVPARGGISKPSRGRSARR